MIDTNMYITYVTCVTYVTYDYVHTLQQIIIINSGIHLFSSPGSQNILLATDVEKSPFPRNAPTSFSFACRCFVLCAALLLINSANLTLTGPSHRINLKHIGNECLSPHGSARCIFHCFLYPSCFDLIFYSFWSQSILTRAFHIETVLQCTLSKL